MNVMANLIVRNVDERIVRALKSRAGKHYRIAEAEHRELLAAVLLKSKTKSFAEVLASIPNAGEDADFARIDDHASTAWTSIRRAQAFPYHGDKFESHEVLVFQ